MHLCTIVWIISSYAQKQPWKDEQVGDMESAWCLQATLRNGENYTNTKATKKALPHRSVICMQWLLSSSDCLD